MTTIVTDDELGTRLPPPPGFVPPTIRERLAKGFEPEASFYVCEGRPHVVWGSWDYAENWSAYPIREVHPYHPVFHGEEIPEAAFCKLVKAMHCIV
jgi:hypothetical protein